MQEALDDWMLVLLLLVVSGGGGVSFRRLRTKKEMEENIWRGKINGDADQPTNQPSDRANIVQSAFSKDGK